MKIAIDIDKTIVDCRSKVYQIANKVEKVIPKVSKKPTEISREEIGKYRNLFGRMGDPKYYEEIDNCIEVINDFTKRGNQVILLSSRPNMRTFNNVILRWLENHEVNYDLVVVNCADKAKFCEQHKVDLLIDDGVKHCVKTNRKGIPTILFDKNDNYLKSHKNEMMEVLINSLNAIDEGKDTSQEFSIDEKNMPKPMKSKFKDVKGYDKKNMENFFIANSWAEISDIQKALQNREKKKIVSNEVEEQSFGM